MNVVLWDTNVVLWDTNVVLWDTNVVLWDRKIYESNCLQVASTNNAQKLMISHFLDGIKLFFLFGDHKKIA